MVAGTDVIIKILSIPSSNKYLHIFNNVILLPLLGLCDIKCKVSFCNFLNLLNVIF